MHSVSFLWFLKVQLFWNFQNDPPADGKLRFVYRQVFLVFHIHQFGNKIVSPPVHVIAFTVIKYMNSFLCISIFLCFTKFVKACQRSGKYSTTNAYCFG